MLHAAPLRPLHTLVRTTEERFRPSQAHLYAPVIASAESALLAAGTATVAQRAAVWREAGRGRIPTVVLGGFVPDSSEQVFLLRRFFLQGGDLYALNYPRDAFSLDLLCAQLDDLVADLAARQETPVLFGVSFGAGLLLEWLQRRRAAQAEPPLAGVVLVSPVACVADVVAPDTPKPATLIGRALKPYLDQTRLPSETTVERSRTVFARMFEAGAQNKAALRRLMTAQELTRLHAGVTGAIQGVTIAGVAARVRALQALRSPTDYFLPGRLPLTAAPALVLFAEREDAMLDPQAPSLFAFRHAVRAYFPRGMTKVVAGRPGQAPVQHASLIFHVYEFLPPLQAFYARLRAGQLPLAA